MKVFAAYTRSYVGRHFHSVRILKSGLPPRDCARPLVIYLNHAAWWDPLVCLLLSREFFPDRTSFAPIDAAMLERYGFFKRLGFFGVEHRTTPRRAHFSPHRARDPRLVAQRALAHAAGTIRGRARAPAPAAKTASARSPRASPTPRSFRSRSSMRSGPSRGRRFSSPSASRSFRATNRAQPPPSGRAFSPTLSKPRRTNSPRAPAVATPPSGSCSIAGSPAWAESTMRGAGCGRECAAKGFEREHHAEVAPMMTSIAAASCLLALVPAALFVRNLALYRPLPQSGRQRRRAARC